MRFEFISGRSIGPFKEFSLDLSKVDGELIAICGRNGAGKSTLLELLAGALYRECPTRGSLTSLATARDAFVEVGVVNGARHTVRQLVDPISAKGESLVLDEAGQPVLTSGKVKEFDAWATKHLPSEQVLYSSSFSPQGRRGFLDLSPSERKRLLVQLLGLERYELMAEAARERAKSARGSLEVLRARLADLPTPDVEALREQVTAAVARVDGAAAAAKAARQAHERAKAAAGDAARAAELLEQRRAAEGRLRAARAQVADLEQRLDNNRALVAQGEEIRASAARATQLEAELSSARAAQAEVSAVLAKAHAEERAAQTALARAKSEAAQSRLRVERAEARLADRERVLAAAAQVTKLQGRCAALESDMEKHRAEVERLQGLVVGGKDERIAFLRGGLRQIVAGAIARVAADTLQSDEARAAEQQEAPTRIATLRKVEASATAELSTIRGQLSAAERLAARAGEMEQAERDRDVEQATWQRLSGEMEAAAAAYRAAAGDSSAAQSLVDVTAAEVTRLQAILGELQPKLELLPRLQQAEARIEELAATLLPAREAAASAEHELAALPEVDGIKVVDLAAAERAQAQAEDAELAARDVLTRARAAVETAEESITKSAKLANAIAEGESELADWTRLAQDLGRDGLQALELDAALPEITAIANDLLHSCHGSRFTVELRSTRLDASGKRELEALEFRVIDTVKGRDADASTYSGGECVICGEAVSLALTVLACRRAGIDRPTIVRDESGAALDAENGRAYVAMLRRAARQLGADRVLYVSHTPELQQLADARIMVADGKVEVAA